MVGSDGTGGPTKPQNMLFNVQGTNAETIHEGTIKSSLLLNDVFGDLFLFF